MTNKPDVCGRICGVGGRAGFTLRAERWAREGGYPWQQAVYYSS